jgi:23S rRNA (adenine2503-C2)-methyltransferase
MKINLYGYELKRLENLMVQYGQKPFRARQLYKWIYEKQIFDFDKMSDISASFRDVLKTDFEITKPTIYKKQVSSDGTIKLLVQLFDNNKIETVLMRYSYGNVVCVSSEIGCNMGCTFSASGLLKKTRSLNTDELVGQILLLNDLLKEEGKGERVSHVVIMGTGEPFDNYDNIMEFIRIINSPYAFAIGARHITVSTCGIPEYIRKYALEGLQTNLAISLHAPNNEIRKKIMPVAFKYPLDEVMDAVKYYEKNAGRRVTFEYILLDGINDSIECAKELKDLIKGTCAYVNLIPYNEVMENKFHRSSENNVNKFFDYLMKNGVNTTIRKEFGSDIDAACGQLRAKDAHKL